MLLKFSERFYQRSPSKFYFISNIFRGKKYHINEYSIKQFWIKFVFDFLWKSSRKEFIIHYEPLGRGNINSTKVKQGQKLSIKT